MSRTEDIRAAMEEAEASLPLERVPCRWGNVRYLLARVERLEKLRELCHGVQVELAETGTVTTGLVCAIATESKALEESDEQD